MGEMNTIFWFKNMKGGDHSEDLDIYWKIILEFNSRLGNENFSHRHPVQIDSGPTLTPVHFSAGTFGSFPGDEAAGT